MKRIHGLAGVIGFAVILTFWVSTVLSELVGSGESIADVKTAIVWGMIILIPSLAIAGATGMAMGWHRPGRLAARKRNACPLSLETAFSFWSPPPFFFNQRPHRVSSTPGFTRYRRWNSSLAPPT